ncbi:hypothetical protein [Piscirickettsia litoralis]|uniref:Uncharacterized protein n=1 Tax=Piscirickettsia litoralis TaxID=1891921 RepID=A0ABX3A4Z6_9GAMM|nr:hypothetical protein [Piscirickettsia litoralis]ODN43933.1 hypothetical protein BGC07_14875 [Piscirickettsia litoralis]
MRLSALILASLITLPALSFASTNISTQYDYKVTKISAESQNNNPILRGKQRVWFKNIETAEKS